MKRTLWVVGAGGHGRDVADIAEECGWRVRFLDDMNLPGVVGRPHELDDTMHYVVGVNDPKVRAGLAVRGRPVTLVHPSASLAHTVRLEPGAVVGAGTTIGPETVINRHAHIGASCNLTRVFVGPFATLAPGVTVAGDVTIGLAAFVGAGATISNLLVVGREATVGLGAAVVDNVPANETVVGVPARPLVPA